MTFKPQPGRPGRKSVPEHPRIEQYGSSGPLLIAVHGGPGAPGFLGPPARRLAESLRVIEPWQRRGGGDPLTVARHVSDLDRAVSLGGTERPALMGHSWGAMLALAYASAHPDRAAALVLVACGTFDLDSRRRLHATLEARTDETLRRRLARLPREFPDPDERMAAHARLTLPLYCHGPLAGDLELARCDVRGNRESWRDMLRLQSAGVYPEAFSAIRAPVLMLHGAADPHPGRMIRAALAAHIPQLEYHEWERCGHYPWLEAAVREDFFERCEDWLLKWLA